MALPTLNYNERKSAEEWLSQNTVTHYRDIPSNIKNAVTRLIEDAHRTQQRLYGELYINTTTIRKITTLGRTKLYELIKKGEFPAAININSGSTRKIWTASAVKNWMQQKADERGKK